MAEDAVEDSAAALMAMRSSPSKRPLRQRQRNRRIFGYDDVVNQPPSKRPVRGSSPTASAAGCSTVGEGGTGFTTCSTPGGPSSAVPGGAASATGGAAGTGHLPAVITDKRVAQILSTRVRNLLKLPQAHKWVCFEWFYSSIDRTLFCGENDFQIVLRESFPGLRSHCLRQVDWCKIRRIMGKPRRCSAAFFKEERLSLEQKRQKIRLLQQRKMAELSPPELKDLPPLIPLPLVIGTKVTARLRVPQDGLFTGTVEALDTLTNTYRITFDRQGLGTHSIPDYEVLSVEPQATIPLSNFQQKQRLPAARYPLSTPPRGSTTPLHQMRTLENDPLLGFSPLHSKGAAGGGLDEGTYGGFPIAFLNQVTKLSKILAVKKEKVHDLRNLNTQAERMQSYGQDVSFDFQKRYAYVVLELEELNRRLEEHLSAVRRHCAEITATMAQDGPQAAVGGSAVAPCAGFTGAAGAAFAAAAGGAGDSAAALSGSLSAARGGRGSEVKTRCDRDAEAMVLRNNGVRLCGVRSQSSLQLITKLISLLLQIKTFGEGGESSLEFRSVQDTIGELKTIVEPSNLSYLRNNVEVHINHIQSGMSQLGNLHAFASSTFQ